MTTGATLMTLKKEANAAGIAAANRSDRGAGWFLTMWLGAIIAISVGAVALLTGIAALMGADTGYFAHAGMGWIGVIGGVGLFALGSFSFGLPSIINSKDKVLAELRDEETNASTTYINALKAELETYGIDTTTMSERNSFKDSDYEFTAQRNDELIDVTVREFGNEIVFMLNGERMQKPVSA